MANSMYSIHDLKKMVQPNIDLSLQLIYNTGMADACRAALEVAEAGGDIKHVLRTLLVGTDSSIAELKTKLIIV